MQKNTRSIFFAFPLLAGLSQLLLKPPLKDAIWARIFFLTNATRLFFFGGGFWMCRDRGGCCYKPKDLPKARVTHSRHLLGGARDRKGANVIGGRDQARPGVGPSGREGPPVSERGGVGKSLAEPLS